MSKKIIIKRKPKKIIIKKKSPQRLRGPRGRFV